MKRVHKRLWLKNVANWVLKSIYGKLVMKPYEIITIFIVIERILQETQILLL